MLLKSIGRTPLYYEDQDSFRVVVVVVFCRFFFFRLFVCLFVFFFKPGRGRKRGGKWN